MKEVPSHFAGSPSLYDGRIEFAYAKHGKFAQLLLVLYYQDDLPRPTRQHLGARLHGGDRLLLPDEAWQVDLHRRALAHLGLDFEVINLIWSPVKPIDLGIEYIHTERTLENRDVGGVRGGRSDRVQAAAIVRF